MADPPPKKVYSIFAPRTKPPPPPPAAAASALASTSSHPSPPQPATANASTDAEGSQGPLEKPKKATKPAKQLSRSVSASSPPATPTASITLSDSDGGSDGTDRSARTVKTKCKRAEKAPQGKAKRAKRVVVSSADEGSEDDLIVVETSSGAKGAAKKGKGKKKEQAGGASTPKKKKVKSNGGVLDLTLSPDRPSGSGTGFASLSETYKKERERRKAYEPVEARWPIAEEHGAPAARTQERTEAQAWAASLPRRAPPVAQDVKGKGREMDAAFMAVYPRPDLFSPAPSTSSAPSPAYETRPLSSVASLVPHFTPHPLLDRLADPLRSPSCDPSTFARPGDERRPVEDQLWTVKYGPKRADEVLGVESGTSAEHLRQWLEELKVQSAEETSTSPTKRRRPVNRGLAKPKKKAKKKKNGLDDFLASDDDEDDTPTDPSLYYDLEDYTSPDDVPSASSSRQSASVFPTLTNLLLLHGPHGSGKTSTVHAVAHELGYEVFEVYPGMGKRRAQDLERYVGDVGKNHIVRASPRKKGGTVDLFSMFAKQGKGGEKGKGKEKAREDEEEKDVEMSEAKTAKGPTQSLILIDEVDVLFAKEDDFWQGVVALAKESRRPIVMTCSDLSLIPAADLGLQQIQYPGAPAPVLYLAFSAPTPDEAVPFLQLIALREGHILDPAALEALYQASTSPSYPAYLAQTQPGDRPLPHPLSGAPLPSRDLRKAVMQLQVELQCGADGTESEGDKGKAKEGETRWIVGGLKTPSPEEEQEEGYEAGGNSAPPSLQDSTRMASPALEALRKAEVAAEAMSAADALVDRRMRVRLEDDDSGRFLTPGDLELAPPLLEPLVPDERREMLPFVGAEPELADQVRALARRVWGDALAFGDREDEALEEKR
ncbi:hypothetical protein JCM10213_002588, partial [Rhodosporidiobolus nylandii]